MLRQAPADPDDTVKVQSWEGNGWTDVRKPRYERRINDWCRAGTGCKKGINSLWALFEHFFGKQRAAGGQNIKWRRRCPDDMCVVFVLLGRGNALSSGCSGRIPDNKFSEGENLTDCFVVDFNSAHCWYAG